MKILMVLTSHDKLGTQVKRFADTQAYSLIASSLLMIVLRCPGVDLVRYRKRKDPCNGDASYEPVSGLQRPRRRVAAPNRLLHFIRSDNEPRRLQREIEAVDRESDPPDCATRAASHLAVVARSRCC
jgi:hypothetical protein